MLRFTLIFAIESGAAARIASGLTKSIARIAPEHCIEGFTVWPSHGWTVAWGREAGATVEFIATLANAVSFAADVCVCNTQDCVYLAAGLDAVLVDSAGLLQTLTHATFAGANIGEFNNHQERLANDQKAVSSAAGIVS